MGVSWILGQHRATVTGLLHEAHVALVCIQPFCNPFGSLLYPRSMYRKSRKGRTQIDSNEGLVGEKGTPRDIGKTFVPTLIINMVSITACMATRLDIPRKGVVRNYDKWAEEEEGPARGSISF